MAFLYNNSVKMNQNITYSKKNFIGSLPTTNFDSSAVEFYSNPIINSINYSGRSYLYTSRLFNKTLRGSLTIEASISIPIFMIVICILISIVSILYLQLSMQFALEETVRQASKTAYISSLFLSLDEDNKQNVANSEPSITESIASSLLSSAYLETTFINNENKKMINNPLIIDGEDGLYFLASSIDLDEGIADIILNYKVKLPFLPEKFFCFNLTNRCYIHLYTGKDLEEKQTQADSYVYFTVYGSVFHFNKYCSYLLNYTDAVKYNNMDEGIARCTKCVTLIHDQLKSKNPIVYITKSQETFHTSLDCPTFTGSIFQTTYSSLDATDKICEQCLKGK